MTDKTAAEPHTDLERLVLGENSIVGTLRIIGYVLIFAVVFGTLFSFLT